MNVYVIRDAANAAAQHAFRRLVTHYTRTGEWDRHLLAEYHVAEALLDLAEEMVSEALPDIPLARIVDLGDHYAGMAS
ncbi:MAG: hypothetical protein WAV64_01965 [Candidatus Moraniibacteriota bacterium]